MAKNYKDNNGTGEFISIGELAEIIDLGKRGIRQLIRRTSIKEKYVRKEAWPGKTEYRYMVDPNGLPEPYRLQYPPTAKYIRSKKAQF